MVDIVWSMLYLEYSVVLWMAWGGGGQGADLLWPFQAKRSCTCLHVHMLFPQKNSVDCVIVYMYKQSSNMAM